MIIVVDLDGTLCDSAHREHLARAKEWEQFHSLLGEDDVHDDVFRLLASVWLEHEIVALTGRNEKFRPATLAWLEKSSADHMFADILMRPDDNYESDHDLKPRLLDEWLTANGHNSDDVWVILEDREKVVEAWRNLGYSCWQPRSGGY